MEERTIDLLVAQHLEAHVPLFQLLIFYQREV